MRRKKFQTEKDEFGQRLACEKMLQTHKKQCKKVKDERPSATAFSRDRQSKTPVSKKYKK